MHLILVSSVLISFGLAGFALAAWLVSQQHTIIRSGTQLSARLHSLSRRMSSRPRRR